MGEIEPERGSSAAEGSSSRPRRTVASRGLPVVGIGRSDDGEGVRVIGGGNGDRGPPEFGPGSRR